MIPRQPANGSADHLEVAVICLVSEHLMLVCHVNQDFESC